MIVAPGSTSVSLAVQIVDDSGLPVTGLVAATFPAAYYYRAGETLPAAITLSDLAAQNSAYSSGGVKEITGGYYRLDVPDAAFATAARVRIIGEASGKRLLCPDITVAYTGVNVIQAAGTAWNSGAIGAATLASDTITAAKIAADAITAAKIADGAIDAATFASDVDAEILSYLVDDAARIDASALNTASAAVGSNGAGLTEAGGTGDHLTALPWNADWDAEVQSECADALEAYDPPTNAEMEARTIAAATYATAANLATVAGYLDTEIAAILEDTGTTLPAQIAALSIPTANQNAAALLDLTDGVESGLTFRQWLRLGGAVLFCESTNGGKTYRDFNDTKDRIVGTMDASNNRTALTRDAT